jgi:hypothetical protein
LQPSACHHGLQPLAQPQQQLPQQCLHAGGRCRTPTAQRLGYRTGSVVKHACAASFTIQRPLPQTDPAYQDKNSILKAQNSIRWHSCCCGTSQFCSVLTFMNCQQHVDAGQAAISPQMLKRYKESISSHKCLPCDNTLLCQQQCQPIEHTVQPLPYFFDSSMKSLHCRQLQSLLGKQNMRIMLRTGLGCMAVRLVARSYRIHRGLAGSQQ